MRPTTAAALLATALCLPAAADDVHLHNGKSFEGVIAEVAGEQVVVQLPAGGEIALDRSLVLRIERSGSALGAYHSRRRALERRAGADAGDWLELALWAREHDLRNGFRQAALEASHRDPRAPGVTAAMHELGYVFDDALGRWLPEGEAMRRRGLVPVEGEWVSRAERDRRFAAARREAEEARREAENAHREARQRAREAQVEQIAELLLARAAADAARPPATPQVYVMPGYFLPLAHRPRSHDRPPPMAPAEEPDTPPSAGAAEAHRGGMEPYGRSIPSSELIPGRLNPQAAPPPGRL